VSEIRAEGFPVEADRLAGALGLDWSLESVGRVQAWLATDRTDVNALAAGCYAGEVLRRLLGGTWQDDGTVAGLGHVAVTMPLAKAAAGEDLVTYVADVVRYAR
jgi:hypothetical protein